MHNRSRRKWGYLLIAPQLIGLIAFSFIPLLFAFGLSLTDWNGFGSPEFVGIENFILQFQNPAFKTALENTLYYSLLYIPTSIFLALLVALALNNSKGKSVYRFCFFAPVVTSSVSISVIWMWIYNAEIGIINQFLANFGINGPDWISSTTWVIPSIAILSIWWQLGYNMVIFLAGLKGISKTYYEAAEMDGASPIRKFFTITLPLLSPTTFFVAIMSVITSFQVFDQAFVMTNGGPGKGSYTLVFHVYDSAFRKFDFGASASAAVILFVFILIFTLIQFAGSKRWVHYEG
ncbi:carbohydrate ABC transporter permease [Aureibacillus halotolerans]|uniref:Carbohydrate ABC transporter membrane protein 1 (CUT1 family) n=1 Tax=Aureibacillus halotolerans TaxID=1508390 RepID=A0A4R6U1J8_9BACI|nr:sugar ABC transporter permease [Aureibacillus halotolerans]TDQ36954.1 carbohydrate ABC transporter membrane protein 1 (CUT1 family) [Aureibacillus halotolerans]